MKNSEARTLLLLSWLTLLATLLAWWQSSASWPPTTGDLISALLLLPVAAILPPVIRGSEKACTVASLLLVLYIGWGLTEAVANPQVRVLAAATVFTGTVSFAALIVWLRLLRSR